MPQNDNSNESPTLSDGKIKEPSIFKKAARAMSNFGDSLVETYRHSTSVATPSKPGATRYDALPKAKRPVSREAIAEANENATMKSAPSTAPSTPPTSRGTSRSNSLG